jgi:hypothetical protein
MLGLGWLRSIFMRSVAAPGGGEKKEGKEEGKQEDSKGTKEGRKKGRKG